LELGGGSPVQWISSRQLNSLTAPRTAELSAPARPQDLEARRGSKDPTQESAPSAVLTGVGGRA